MQKLGEVCENRDNGFNFLRLVAATGILVAHCLLAVPVINESSMTVPVQFRLAADLLLAVFFVFSGFLITASLERSQNLLRFALARILRIYPALIVSTAGIAMVLGPMVSHLPIAVYFGSLESWLYLPRAILLLDANAALPGVFNHHPVANAVNIPIWTLRYEVLIYAAFPLLALMFIKRSAWLKGAALLASMAGLLAAKYMLVEQDSQSSIGGLVHLANFFTSFLIGCSLWTFRRHVPNNLIIVVFLWALFALSSDFFLNYFFGVIAAGYTFIWIAFLNISSLRAYGSAGDYSYGIYVMHFPIAQAIYGAHPSVDPLLLSGLTFILTFPVAFLSWRWVEKPALMQVKNLTNYITAIAARMGPSDNNFANGMLSR